MFLHNDCRLPKEYLHAYRGENTGNTEFRAIYPTPFIICLGLSLQTPASGSSMFPPVDFTFSSCVYKSDVLSKDVFSSIELKLSSPPTQRPCELHWCLARPGLRVSSGA